MAERPILFSGPMVQAILDGTKTQTRRVVKPQPVPDSHAGPGDGVFLAGVLHRVRESRGRNKAAAGHLNGHPMACPYGIPGDLLWVRETWGAPYADAPGVPDGRKPAPGDKIVYRADPADDWQWSRALSWSGWRPSIHMPRWACRLTLRVTDVRVERLQEITDEDAAAEGLMGMVPPANRGDGLTPGALAMAAAAGIAAMPRPARRQFLASVLAASLGIMAGAKPWEVASGRFGRAPTPAEAFRILWDTINAKRGFGWDVNPWVWVVTFERTEAPHA